MISRVLPLLLLLLIPALAAGQEGAAADAAPPAEAAAPVAEPLPQTPVDATAAPAPVDGATATAVDAVAQPVPEPVPESAPAADVTPAPINEAIPEAASSSAPAPESIAREDRQRSVIILVSSIILIAGLLALIFVLIRRGRELGLAGQAYVAEAYLNDLHGSTPQPAYQLGSKPIMLGRVAGKDTEHVDYIVIPQSTIGRRHALIEYKDFAYWIMDQGSINGTFVNDKAVGSEIRLKHGDRVRLHKYQFEFVMPDVGETGKTVISETRLVGKGVEQTGQAAGGAKTGAATSPEEAELLRNLAVDDDHAPVTENPPARAPAASPRTGNSRPGAAKDVIIDETLMPMSGRSAPHVDGDDETLLPGGGLSEDGEVAGDADDETLMPGATPPPSAADGKDRNVKEGSGDEFFDITGSVKDGDK